MIGVVIFGKIKKISNKGLSSFEPRAVTLHIQCEYVNYLCLITDAGGTGEGCVICPHVRSAKRKIRLQRRPPVQLPTDSRCFTLVGRQTPSLTAGHLVSLCLNWYPASAAPVISHHPILNMNTTHYPYTIRYVVGNLTVDWMGGQDTE